MKWYPRLKVYKASNVTFDPTTKCSFSYDWWMFTDVVNGKLVFNNYYYSSTTRKHQHNVKLHLASRGIKVDLFVNTRLSLSSIDSGRDALDTQMHDLVSLMVKQLRGRKDYAAEIKIARENLSLISQVFKVKIDESLFDARLHLAVENEEERICALWLERQLRKEEKALRAASACPVINMVRSEFANATQN